MFTAEFEVHRLQRSIEIGCADDEHGITQPVEITLRATLGAAAMFAGDTKTPPYDYESLTHAVDAALASRPRFILQETLFIAIAARVLADPLVERLHLAIAKTARYAGCDWIGIAASVDRQALREVAARYPEDRALDPWRS